MNTADKNIYRQKIFEQSLETKFNHLKGHIECPRCLRDPVRWGDRCACGKSDPLILKDSVPQKTCHLPGHTTAVMNQLVRDCAALSAPQTAASKGAD